MSKFYIIFSPEGTTAPTKMHPSHKEALAIAHQMAARHAGQRFFVMESASKPVIVEVEAEAEAA